MSVTELQKQVNDDISEELDKYQVILEYGRMFLDRDKEIRDKHKWIKLSSKWVKAGWIIDFVIALFTTLLSSSCMPIFLKNFLPIGVTSLIILSVALVGYYVVLYCHRETIAKLVSKEDRGELESLLNVIQEYLAFLSSRLKRVNSSIKQTKSIIDNIKEDLEVEKRKLANIVNRISFLQGNLDEVMDAKAHKISEERLQPLIKYTYKK